jgi:hypothetical protein
MHKIDSPHATPGNEFTEGDPSVPIQATEVSAKWLNTIQRELVYVVADVADLDLDDEDDTQLAQAIAIMITAAINAHLAAADPHPQYLTDVVFAAHLAAADPHPQYLTDVVFAAHLAPGDPHPQYVRHDAPQGLPLAQQAQARENIDAPSNPFVYFCGQF